MKTFFVQQQSLSTTHPRIFLLYIFYKTISIPIFVTVINKNFEQLFIMNFKKEEKSLKKKYNNFQRECFYFK